MRKMSNNTEYSTISNDLNIQVAFLSIFFEECQITLYINLVCFTSKIGRGGKSV